VRRRRSPSRPDTGDASIASFSPWVPGADPLGVSPEEHCRAVLSGIPGSPGLSLGRVYLHTSADLWVEAHDIGEEQVDQEIARFLRAVDEVIAQRRKLQQRAEETIGRGEAQIFESHIMLLQDSDLINGTIGRIRTERKNAEYCFYVALQRAIGMIARLETHNHLRERAVDLEDIRSAVLMELSGATPQDPSQLLDNSIVVAHFLTPSDTARMPPEKVIGFVTDAGGPTSHASILARSMGIPAALGCVSATASVEPGATVLLDGFTGKVYIEPDEVLQDHVRRWMERQAVRVAAFVELLRVPAETLDGHRVRLELNIELPEGIARAAACPGDGVGLFRTEFLFMARDDWPGEEEQYAVYAQLAEAFGERPVTIRTMDIGGDKLSRRLHVNPEMNPFLGWRAIRISLAQPDVFQAQLAAVLRASARGNVRLMFPLVTSLEEFRQALDHVREVRMDLDRRGLPYDPGMPVGVMIETPAAVMIADALAKEADFFSIGTNDLVQYTLAVDRNNEHVATLFDAYHPAILRLIRETIEAGRRAGIEVYVCGEMANQPLATMLLVGLGIDGLSMAPGGIPEIKHHITRFSLADARRVAREALAQVTGEEVRRVLRAALAERDLRSW